ncbi:hypothetical protein KRR26_22305 [Corallococcus sp. M34]|uniref:OTU domain-containing protein n=1 Tax=Citreicoccus inhibens TaxID=2849499 RepID=UPI001C23045D|nr:hypothetical protein [Citreicoccus inhibens]MBU8898348.1 hypothetical protein [Citreicoccus inhibens]
MRCPNCGNDFMIDESSGSPKCTTCNADLIPTSGDEADTSQGDLTFEEALRDDDELRPEEVARELRAGSYDATLEELLEPELHRLSSTEMSAEIHRATSSPSLVASMEFPTEELEDKLVEERRAPLGEETVVADKPVVPKSFPLRVLLWNIADLGGGPSGTLPVRKDWTISALAHIIRTASPDVATILELKKKGGMRLTEPKPPQPMQQSLGRRGKNLILDAVVTKYVAPLKLNSVSAQAVEGALLTDLARFFAARVRWAFWPGAQDPDGDDAAKQAPDPQWSPALSALGQERTQALEADVAAAWKRCEPGVMAEFASSGPLDVATLDVKGKTADKLARFRKQCVALLKQQRYVDWLEPYMARYPTNQKSAKKDATDDQKKDAEEKKRLDELSDLATDELWNYGGRYFRQFLETLMSSGPSKAGLSAARENAFELILQRSNHEHRQRVYEKKHAEYLKQKNELEDSADLPHAGLREFLRIRDALNNQCRERGEEPYLSWPDAVPDKPRKGLYTQDEAYGVLWRKSKVEVDEAGVVYLSTYLAKRSRTEEDTSSKMELQDIEDEETAQDDDERDVHSHFIKREPIRVPVKLAQVKGAPSVGIVAWHPPAPGVRNQEARGKDFPSFLRYCQEERKAKALGVLLSDLNIDTARPKNTTAPDGTPLIDTCVPNLSFNQFFGTLLGPSVDPRHLYELADQQSTIAKSKFNSWRVDEARDFGNGTQQTLRSLFNKAVRPEMFATQTTAQGNKLGPRLAADELLGYIESFATPPQQRYGASGYDKILVYSPSTDGWTLEQQSVSVIPFPMAIASEEEKDLFLIHGNSLPEHLKPFWTLIQREDAQKPESQRIFASLRPNDVSKSNSADARWEVIMAAAKKLSDHMPLVSNLRLVYSGKDALVLEEPALIPVASTELSQLRSLCAKYQAASFATNEEAAQHLGAILDAAQKVPEAEHGLSAVLVAEAMQLRETLDVLRAEGFEDGAHWAKRPTLKKVGTGGASSTSTSLESHLKGLPTPMGLVKNEGGGDCMFLALSQLLFGTEEHHGVIRQAVVNHLEDLLQGTVQDAGGRVGPVSVAEFQQHMGLLLDWHREGWPNEHAYRRVPGMAPWGQYLRAMSRDHAWGDLVALSAASHLFEVRIQLYVRTGANTFRTDLVDFVPRAEGHEHAPMLQLANLDQTHFVAVQPSGELPPVAVEFPPRFESLSERRRRDEGKSSAPPSDSKPQETAPPKTAGTDPFTGGPVCLWNNTVYFTAQTPGRHPDALFLFGENDQSKKNPQFQANTQAVIRMCPNAHGIRTCWVPGVGMTDKDLAKNTAAIDEDLEEAKTKLLHGPYTALVVPWDYGAKTVGIGTGVAGLNNPANSAQQTWAHLKKGIDGLITWAQTNVGKVHMVPQKTGLLPPVAKHRPTDLYVQEVSQSMSDAWSVDASSSTSLRAADNVVELRTSWHPGATSADTGLMTDAEYEKNKAAIDKGLAVLRQKVESGKFQRLVLPLDSDGKHLMGTQKGLLGQHAPKTLKYLHDQLDQLVKRCGEIQFEKSLPMDTDDSFGATLRPDYKRKHRLDSDDEDDAQPHARSEQPPRVIKKVRTLTPPNSSQQDNAKPELVVEVMDDEDSDAFDPVSVKDDGPHKKQHMEDRRD